MPTYAYLCSACDHEFEIMQKMSDSIKKKCPECKKMKLRRLIGAGAGVIFKGSGFYETDYRSDSYKDGKKKSENVGKPKNKKADKTIKKGPAKKN